MLIALGGLPGVGKSTLAALLARRLGALHLRVDTIEQAMRSAGFTVSGPEGYLAARDVAEDNLRLGHTVIVDSVNPLEVTRTYWRETAGNMAVELVEIEVVCTDEREHRRRVESRVDRRPRARAPDLAAGAGSTLRAVADCARHRHRRAHAGGDRSATRSGHAPNLSRPFGRGAKGGRLASCPSERATRPRDRLGPCLRGRALHTHASR